MASNQDRFSAFQSQILWVAIACLAAKFLLETDSAKEMFGTWWLTVKQANAVIMWLAAIFSGKKFIDLLERFKKITEETRTGKNE